MQEFIRKLFTDPQMLRMGHAQSGEDLNLGLGWIYYGLARLIRPQIAVVIGSYRGFVPAIIARALAENSVQGQVLFIDPSYADDFWRDPERVQAHFAGLGTTNVRHFCQTTQEFVRGLDYAKLGPVGLLMVDGYHSAEQARFDYLAFLPKLSADSAVIFHDTLRERTSTFYGPDRAYQHTVCHLMERLGALPGMQVLTLPFGAGATLVRGRPASAELLDGAFS
jgi:predicted O-methyltransferase YrrM